MNEHPHRTEADAEGVVDQNEFDQSTTASAKFQSQLDYALQYVARGWFVLPLTWPIFPNDAEGIAGRCSCGHPKCPSAAKHPLIQKGANAASNDATVVENWWARWPQANIGIATGPSGLVVLDIDGVVGREQFVREIGKLPETLTAKTGRPDGFHLYYEGAIASSQKKGEHLDVRGTSGYVVAPCSMHLKGRIYQWVNSQALIVPVPEQLVAWNTNRRGGKFRKASDNFGEAGRRPRPAAANRQEERNPQPADRESARESEAATSRENVRRVERLRAGTALQKAELPVYSIFERNKLCSALAVIPADLDGRTWASYGMALADLEWVIEENGNLIDVGLEIWDAWSRTSKGHGPGNGEYKGRDDLERRWSKFTRHYKGPRITIASIYADAKERGWQDPTRSPVFASAINQTPGAGLPSQNLKIIRGDELLSTKAPPRQWVVEKWVPAAEVTMLGGDGGLGKSTLALQLSLAFVTGRNWLGLKVSPCNVLYVSAEDPLGEVHFRLQEIVTHSEVSQEQLGRFKLIDIAGRGDAAVALFGDKGQIEGTPLFAEIENAAREHSVGCIIFDAVADFFGGNENERREVRAFIALLRGLALRLNTAIVIIAHPSVDGIKTGRGYSGSTHWNNAVRSRLYFTDVPEDKEKGPPNLDLRVIELAKSNRARRGEKMHVIWDNGRFLVTSTQTPVNLEIEKSEDERFLECLAKAAKQGIHVSPYRSPSYAPTIFAKMAASKAIGKAALERAMHRLIDKGKIRDQPHGPASKQRHRLVIEERPMAQ